MQEFRVNGNIIKYQIKLLGKKREILTIETCQLNCN